MQGKDITITHDKDIVLQLQWAHGKSVWTFACDIHQRDGMKYFVYMSVSMSFCSADHFRGMMLLTYHSTSFRNDVNQSVVAASWNWADEKITVSQSYKFRR